MGSIDQKVWDQPAEHHCGMPRRDTMMIIILVLTGVVGDSAHHRPALEATRHRGLLVTGLAQPARELHVHREDLIIDPCKVL